MKTLHESTARQALLDRVDALRPDSQRQWGLMRVDQMLRHVNAALEMTLGRLKTKRKRINIPLPLFKPVGGHWVDHPALGRLTGTECTKLQYKHLDHHLRQFGV